MPHVISAADLEKLATSVMVAVGCDDDIAAEVAEHLVEADLRGVGSHGTMRLTQYAKQGATGYLTPSGRPTLTRSDDGAWIVDGGGGFGHPAMNRAVEKGLELVHAGGMSVVAVRNVGHTGRIGAYSERGAEAGCLAIVFGGGARHIWQQVAPFGGIDPMLPTNPYSIAVPGGDHGPVVLDFATGSSSGGRAMAAHVKGELFDEPTFIDGDGRPSRDPNAYLSGGAILPAAGPKGYGMGVVAELMADALLGPVDVEGSWLLLFVKLGRFRSEQDYQPEAERLLDELRSSRPAEGFDRVEIPGERERAIREQRLADGIPMDDAVWSTLEKLRNELGQ